MNSFDFLFNFQVSEGSKDDVTQCFSSCKELLQTYLRVIGAIKMTPVLEDELEILICLCQDLVKFHEVLVRVDVKLSLMVWKVYIQLTNKYLNKLTDKLDFSVATEKISSELRANFIQLRSNLSSHERSQNVVKVTMKVVHFLKALLLVAAQAIGRSRSFLGFLLELEAGLPEIPSWAPEVVKNNIIAVILSPQNKVTLLKLAAQQPFLSVLMEDQPGEESAAHLQLSVDLLLLRPAQSHTLLTHCFKLVSAGACCLDLPKQLEGRPVLFRPAVKVDLYTWSLTNLCAYLFTSDRQEFVRIEKVLLGTLLDPSSSLVTLMLVSDIWCFCAKIAPSRLCLSQMKTLRSVNDQMRSKGFTLTVLVIEVLLLRLRSFLNSSDSSHWKSQLPGDDVPVEEKWEKLAKGEYRPVSSVSLSRLTEDTVSVLAGLSEEKVKIVLGSCHHLARRSHYSSHLSLSLLTLLSQLTRDRRHAQVTLDILNDVAENSSWNFVGGSCCIFQTSSIFHLLKAPPPTDLIESWKRMSAGEVTKDCVCKGWSAEKAETFNEKINKIDPGCLKDGVEKQEDRSPESKKRKISHEKENIQLAVVRLEKDSEYLSQQNSRDLKPFSDSIKKQNRRLQDILKKIDDL